jgi:hypothetical protein
VAHFASGARFGADLGALQGYAAIQLFVDGFIDHAHAALTQRTYDAETIPEQSAGRKEFLNGNVITHFVTHGERDYCIACYC